MKILLKNLFTYPMLLMGSIMSCSNIHEEIPAKSITNQISDEGLLIKKFLNQNGNGIIKDTIIPVKKNALPIQKGNAAKINWGQIKKEQAQDIRYLAIGGSWSAGVRNGGLYNESQLTSFPNLIANQLGISNFKQPLFDEQEGNGSGYKVLLQTKPILKYAVVKNNLAIKANEPFGFTKKLGDYDNIAVAFGGGFGLTSDQQEPQYSFGATPYYYRINPKDEEHYGKFIENQKKVDFFTYEFATMAYLQTALLGGYRRYDLSPIGGGVASDLEMLENLKSKGAKWGILLNVPDVIDFPIFHLYTLSDIKRITGIERVLVSVTPSITRDAVNTDIFIPNDNFIYLISNTNAKETSTIVFEDKDILGLDEIPTMIGYNQGFIEDNFSKKSGFPVLDLYGLYKKIMKGNYISDDGVLVDPTFPTGNFFSDDGIYPTAFGQAIIANECIKLLNKTYQSNIDLLNTKQFLNK